MIIRGTPKGIRTPVSGVKGRQLGQLVHGSIPLDSLYSGVQHCHFLEWSRIWDLNSYVLRRNILSVLCLPFHQSEILSATYTELASLTLAFPNTSHPRSYLWLREVGFEPTFSTLWGWRDDRFSTPHYLADYNAVCYGIRKRRCL